MDLVDEIIGYIASVLTILSLLPQLIKICRNKSANDVALSTYFIFVLVEILWLYYGIKIVNYQIIIANGTCCLMSISVIVLGYLYKKKENEHLPITSTSTTRDIEHIDIDIVIKYTDSS
jgi:MtN3 and saliva related transmembrane protein